MDRSRYVFAWPLVALLSLVIAGGSAGCGWLALAIHTVNPNDVRAEFDDLDGKRVVVVCRPVLELQFADSTVPRELSRQVGLLIAKKVPKARVVDEAEVFEWVDENSFDSYTEVGKALKADMVVGIDLESFGLHQGTTLYQGNSSIRLAVYDMQNGGRAVYEKSVPRILYPPHTPIPSVEKAEGQFRQQFLSVLAEQIARHFYAHESRVDFATDANL